MRALQSLDRLTDWGYVGTTGTPMSSLVQQLRLENLRALLVCNRIEKAGLSAEICSASTTPERKKEAINRYAQVVTELRTIGHDLGILTGK